MLERLRAEYPRLFSSASLLLWLSALWKAVEFILNWIGVVDTVRAAMDPQHWVSHLLFWPHLGLFISILGVGGLFLLIWLDRAERETLARPITGEPERGGEPSNAIIPPILQPIVTTTPSTATPLVGDRIVVDITPEDLTSLFEQQLSVQAKKLVEIYIGKWLKVSGPLGDVRTWQVTFADGTFRGAIVFMYPSDGFIDQCSVLSRGKRIEVLGRIREVNSIEVHLEDCELIV